jgi:hypothetical protein
VTIAGCGILARNEDCFEGQAVGDIVEINFVEVLAVEDILRAPSCEGLDRMTPGPYRFQVVWRGVTPGHGGCGIYGVRPLEPIGDLAPPPGAIYPIGGPFSAAIPYCDGFWKLLSGSFTETGEIPYGVPYVPGERPLLTMRRSIEGYECDGMPPRYCADTWAAEVRLISRGNGDAGLGDGG